MARSMLKKRVLKPLRRIWRFLCKRLFKAHKKKSGIYVLYEDVKSCNDEDINVLWSIFVNLHNNTHCADSVSVSAPWKSIPCKA
ncbi:hypothetical protein SUGI_0211610 [Cryptomeria japonica]|nr:hypothetical protein SUGI_0211610 [Cryptomeria japonica]